MLAVGVTGLRPMQDGMRTSSSQCSAYSPIANNLCHVHAGYRRGYDRDEHEAPTRAPQPPSRADEDNDWVAHKKFVPSDSANSHSFTGSAYGGGSSYRNDRRFEDPPRPYSPRHPPGSPGSGPASPSGHRSGFNFSGPSRADAEERWSHISPVSSPKPAALSSPGSTERPRERPRLSLASRTLPLDGQPAAALSPRSPLQDGATQATDQPQQQVRSPKPNPFGGARPREDVLKAKGIDYHKEELKLEHGEVIRWVLQVGQCCLVHARLHACMLWLHACMLRLPSLPACLACMRCLHALPACLDCMTACLHALTACVAGMLACVRSCRHALLACVLACVHACGQVPCNALLGNHRVP